MTLRTRHHPGYEFIPDLLVLYGPQNIDQKGVNDVGIIVIEVKLWAVSVEAIAHIPLIHLTQGIIDSH